MSSPLGRIGSWLVEPAGAITRAAPRARVPVRDGPAPDLAVLAGPRDAHALAAVLALRLGGGPGVVGLWQGAGGSAPALPATFSARRLRASLDARGLGATVAGRLLTVVLPLDERAGVAAAERLCAACGDAPVVLAVAGPRGAEWDRLLAARDLVVVHAREDSLAELAVARLAEQGVPAAALDRLPGAPARALARAGLALPGAGAGLAPLLRAVRA
jgi:hypothetical protein